MCRDLESASSRRSREWVRKAEHGLFAIAVPWSASSLLANYLEAVPAWFAGGRARGIAMLLWTAIFVLGLAAERGSEAPRNGGSVDDALPATWRPSGCTTALFVLALVGIGLDVVSDTAGWLGDPSDHDLGDLWLLAFMVAMFADYWKGRGSEEGRGPR